MTIGTVLDGRYELKEFVGKGGMALVYRAIDLRTGHSVAVKILRPEFNEDVEFLARFQREATTASKMSHHNIVNLLDVGKDGSYQYLVMEYVKGKTLKEVLEEKGALPPPIAAQIAIRILSALQHAHNNGIIHRDIKPQNILVHSEGHVKVADFGIARVAGSNTISKADSVMGSVHYFSPEQARGEDVSSASDLYSVGVVLYEMLTGVVPFDGETPVVIALQHLSGKARPVSELKEGIPHAMERVVMKAMEVKPEHRYQSALEMAQDLHRALHEPDGEWMGRSQDKPIPGIAQVGASQQTGRHPKVKRNVPVGRWLAVLALAALVMFALGRGAVMIYDQIINTTSAPYLVGETEDNAIRLAKRAQLKPQVVRVSDDVVPLGIVILQTPEYETVMKKNDTILLTVSSGPSEQSVPAITGMLEADARLVVEKVGLTLLALPDRVLSAEAYGTVLSQSPLYNEKLSVGGIVKVTLSGGCVTVPNLVNQKIEDAMKFIDQENLILSERKNIEIADPAMAGLVAAQLFKDSQSKEYKVGEQVMQQTMVELAVYVLAPTATPAPEGTSTP